MKNILHVISSPKGLESYSTQLGNAIINKLTSKFPKSTVVERNLLLDDTNPIPYLSGEEITAFFKNQESLTEEEQSCLQYSDIVLKELQKADIVVLNAPMYNFSIHACLKAYIDQIIRINQSFAYLTDGSRVGLLSGKTVYLCITTGGKYMNTSFNPTQKNIIDYLTTIFTFIGIEDIKPFVIEGTASPSFSFDFDSFITDL